ncbi:MAG: hypothetical protein ACLP19_08225 [Xanthobacteraceae bacterium]
MKVGKTTFHFPENKFARGFAPILPNALHQKISQSKKIDSQLSLLDAVRERLRSIGPRPHVGRFSHARAGTGFSESKYGNDTSRTAMAAAKRRAPREDDHEDPGMGLRVGDAICASRDGTDER